MKLKRFYTILALLFLSIQSFLPVMEVFAIEPITSTTEEKVTGSTTTEVEKIEETETTKDFIESQITTDTPETSKTEESLTQTSEGLQEKIGESQNANDSPSPKIETEENKLFSKNKQAFTQLMGNEGQIIKEELVTFMNSHMAEIQAIKGASYKAHVGYTASNGHLYEFLPIDTEEALRQQVEARLGITIRVVQTFQVNWHIRMPGSGLETWGEVFDEMATPDGQPLFCIDPGILVNGTGGYTETVMPSQITKKMQQGATIGYTKVRDIPHYWNTQTFLWDELGVQWLQNSLRDQVLINSIHNGISNLAKRPSFQNKEVTLIPGKPLTLTDTNGVFKDYENLYSNTAGIKIEHQGNQMVLTANEKSNSVGEIVYRRYRTQPINIAYFKPGSQTVAVLGDPNRADVTIPIKVLKNGHVKLKKVDADTGATLPGAKFKLSYNGKNVEKTTNAQGEIDLRDITVGTKVTMHELIAPNGYVLNKTPQTVTVEANKTATVVFKNKKQVGRLELIKEDKEKGGAPQGSATLEGVVYGLVETNGQKVKEVTLKKAGDKVTGAFEPIKIMHDYYVQEIKAPEGYNEDKTKYPVRIDYAGQDKTVAIKKMTVKDQVIKGGIELIKIANKPLIPAWFDRLFKENVDIKPPLEGVEFTITSKTTNKVVKVLTTDKEGKAATGKTLPYDTYLLTETKTPEGHIPIRPIEFTISKENQKFYWVLENRIIEARLHLIKVDAETGKNIPLRDTTFKIWDRWAKDGEGDYVSMRVPNSMDVSDEFKTNEKGEFVTSDSLPYGKDRYEIRELRAPEGYLLATEPIVFSVLPENADSVIRIEFKNTPQKGQVKVEKTGETGVSLVEKEGEYGPFTEIVYDQMPLEGVQFKIRARENITTPDGTVRLEEGQFVQKEGADFVLLTDKDGEALSEPNLYLGKYELVEIDAPSGFVKQKEPIPFELKYEGQLVEVSSTSVAVENHLQEINVMGHKKQEVVTGWTNGEAEIELENAKNDQVFGLFVGEGGVTVGDQILSEGTALAYAKVQEGQVMFEGMKFPNVKANFYLQEVDAGNEHVLDPTKYPFVYEPSTNDDSHEIHVFSDSYAVNKEILTKMVRKDIVNRLARTDVELVKVDNLGEKPLLGVEFELFRVEDEKETSIGTFTTDKQGTIVLKNLPTGQYRFKETKPLPWYFPNTDDLSVTVTPETDGQKITVQAVNKRKPMKITTVLADVNGKKEIDPTVENTLRDKVSIEGAEVGHTYTIVTPYVDPDTKKVLQTVETTYTAKSENETIYVDIPLPKNTMTNGQKGTATHVIYYDKEKTKVVGKEDDLKNKDQTVVAKTPKVSPKSPSVLPKAGERQNSFLMLCGLGLVIGAFYFVLKGNRKSSQ